MPRICLLIVTSNAKQFSSISYLYNKYKEQGYEEGLKKVIFYSNRKEDVLDYIIEGIGLKVYWQ